MGTIRLKAIIVSTCAEPNRTRLNKAIALAKQLGLTVIGPSDATVNSYRTFLVCPDGSKLGWQIHDEAEEARNKYIAWLEEEPEFGWVYVGYGEDYVEGDSAKIESSSYDCGNC